MAFKSPSSFFCFFFCFIKNDNDNYSSKNIKSFEKIVNVVEISQKQQPFYNLLQIRKSYGNGDRVAERILDLIRGLVAIGVVVTLGGLFFEENNDFFTKSVLETFENRKIYRSE